MIALLGLSGLLIGAAGLEAPGTSKSESVKPCKDNGCTFFREAETDDLVLAYFAIEYPYDCTSVDKYTCYEIRCP